MKFSFKKILLVIFFITSAFLSSSVPLSLAQNKNDQQKCDEAVYFKEARTLFYSFYDYRRTFDLFTEAWRSIRWGSDCYGGDLNEVRRRIEKMRSSLRKAFMACSPRDQIEKIKKDYWKAETEYYFLQNAVQKKDKFVVLSKEAILTKMKDYFVNGKPKKWLTDEQVEAYVHDFFLLYEDTFTNYNSSNCENKGWKMIKEKVEELKKTAGGFKKIKDEWNKQTKKLAQRQKNRAERKAAEKEMSKPGLMGFLENNFAVTMGGLKPEETLKKIADEARKNMPNYASPSFQALNEAKVAEGQRYQQDLDLAKLQLEYEVMYKNTGAEIAASFVNLLDQTIDEVKTGTEQLTEISKCATTTFNKQCN